MTTSTVVDRVRCALGVVVAGHRFLSTSWNASANELPAAHDFGFQPLPPRSGTFRARGGAGPQAVHDVMVVQRPGFMRYHRLRIIESAVNHAAGTGAKDIAVKVNQ